MSIDSAREFVNRVCSDNEFAKNLSDYKDVEEFCNSPKAKEAGFSFSTDDLHAVKKELTEEQKANLRCQDENCNWLGG